MYDKNRQEEISMMAKPFGFRSFIGMTKNHSATRNH